MEFIKEKTTTNSIRFAVKENGEEIGRACLYLIHNEQHFKPYGLIEDVFVKETHRRKGIGTMLINKLIEEARKNNCYKLIATSRMENEKVHALYDKLNFEKHGFEFRLDF